MVQLKVNQEKHRKNVDKKSNLDNAANYVLIDTLIDTLLQSFSEPHKKDFIELSKSIVHFDR